MESHKLDLMAEVAELRMRLQTAENEKVDYRERYENAQHQVLDLHEKLIARDREITELKTFVTSQNNKPNHMVNGNGYYNHHDQGEVMILHDLRSFHVYYVWCKQESYM